MKAQLITILFFLPLFGLAQRAAKPRFIEDIVIAEERALGPVSLIVKSDSTAPSALNHSEDHGNKSVNHSVRIEDLKSLQFKYALITNREVEALADDQLYEFIDEWRRTPYRMGGTSKSGVDCSGFTRELMRDVYHVELPRTARDQYEDTRRISQDELSEGDLVFFYTGGYYISHVGVYLGNNYFVHSSSSNGVKIGRAHV